MLKALLFSIFLFPIATLAQDNVYYRGNHIVDQKDADRVAKFFPNPDGTFGVILSCTADRKRICTGDYSAYDPTLCANREGQFTWYHRTGFTDEEGTYKNNKRTGIWKSYAYENGNLVGEVPYVDDSEHGHAVYYNFKDHSVNGDGDFVRGRKNGRWKAYRSGKLWLDEYYKNGMLDGEKIVYQNGVERLRILFSEGKFVSGRAFDENGREVAFVPERRDSTGFSQWRYSVDTLTLPPYDYNDFLSSHIIYPDEARSNGITGRVVVMFEVDEEGNCHDAVVLRGVHPLLDREALRVVGQFPKWIPAKQDGRLVKTFFTLPIQFWLE